MQVDKNNFNPDVTGTYSITFKVTDADGYTASHTMEIEVIRTINVTVPAKIPFQVVTNLIEDPNNPSQDRFIAGVMTVRNNNTTPVEVSVKSFCKVQGSGNLELVDPTSLNWDDLSVTDSMNKMALGLYHVSGFNNVTNLTKDSPIWLTEQITNQSIGQLPRASSLSNPSEGKLSFIAKYGKNFESGKTRAKFNLVLEFR